MKNRKFSILLILLLSASFMIAQENSKISFAVLGGANFNNLNGKAFNGDKLENDMLLGFHAGVNVLIPIVPEFYFQPGLLFATKGAKNSSDILGISTVVTTTLNYLELPLNMVYKAEVGSGSIMLGFGPYVAYGLGGKWKSESVSTIGTFSADGDVVFQNTVESSDPIANAYYRPFDAGANIFFGYELAVGVFLQLDAQFGLLNINPEYKARSNDKSITNNTGFGLSLGYRF